MIKWKLSLSSYVTEAKYFPFIVTLNYKINIILFFQNEELKLKAEQSTLLYKCCFYFQWQVMFSDFTLFSITSPHCLNSTHIHYTHKVSHATVRASIIRVEVQNFAIHPAAVP